MPSALACCLLLCSITALVGHQDCGQCGLRCQNYSDAAVASSRQRAISCAPGGGEARLEAPHQEFSSPAPARPTIRSAIPTPADAMAAVFDAPGCGRRHLAKPRFRSRMRLCKEATSEA